MMPDKLVEETEKTVNRLREVQNALFKVCEENNERDEGERLKDSYVKQIHSAVVRIQEAIDLLK